MSEELNKQIEALRSHHVTLNYLAVAIILIVFAIGTWFMTRSVSAYERLMSKADERFSEYEKRLTDREKDWQKHEQERSRIEQEQTALQKAQSTRATALAKRVNDVTAIRTPEQVAEDSKAILGVVPVRTGSLFSFTVPQVQGFEKTSIEYEACQGDLRDTRQQLILEQEQTKTLDADLVETHKSLDESKSVIDAYKRVAKKTKFQRVLGVFYDVGKIGIGVLIGRVAR